MSNRLANESSPYLLQHAENPVDWYPWSAEALLRAKAEDKPIFLSIGYSACHWCHVMEHESFENDGIAALLNENFINIKVDREERPDLDHIYMQAVMALQGHGGWPLSVFLTPTQEVFFGGTYWPPESRPSMPGFGHVLQSVLGAYHNNREQIDRQSLQITEMLQASSGTEGESDTSCDGSLIDTALRQLHRQFDNTFGGFGGAPKFPHTMDLELLLLQYQKRSGAERNKSAVDSEVSDGDLLEMINTTLQKMARGGIFDHLAGGFARYSVDARWLVPHFEKMLYDNAQLASVYLRAYQATANPLYGEVCSATLDYLLSYMIDSSGGFHSTEDADSEGVEGKFYVWSRAEILDVLGKSTGERFCHLYNVTERGNFEGSNILNMSDSLEAFANREGLDARVLSLEIRGASGRLLQTRDKRIRPAKDDKVLVSWNSLAIDAFARAAVVLGQSTYAHAARDSASFVWDHMRDGDGRLLHTWRHGQAKLGAYLDDYAYLINSLVSLYFSEQDQVWIDRAFELAELMIGHFADTEAGGFFFTSDDHEQLIARTKDYQDSSVPSGNSMAALALLRLGRLCGHQPFLDQALSTIESGMPFVRRAPMAAGQLLLAVDVLLRPSRELVLVANSAEQNLVDMVKTQSDLDTAVIVIDDSVDQYRSPRLEPVLRGKRSDGNRPTLYICQNHACQQPTIGRDAICEALDLPEMGSGREA